LLSVATISPETKFIEVRLVVAFTAMVMDAPEPAFNIHDLLMERRKPAAIATSLLFCFWEKFL
jgi:hypothetical protein